MQKNPPFELVEPEQTAAPPVQVTTYGVPASKPLPEIVTTVPTGPELGETEMLGITEKLPEIDVCSLDDRHLVRPWWGAARNGGTATQLPGGGGRPRAEGGRGVPLDRIGGRGQESRSDEADHRPHRSAPRGDREGGGDQEVRGGDIGPLRGGEGYRPSRLARDKEGAREPARPRGRDRGSTERPGNTTSGRGQRPPRRSWRPSSPGTRNRPTRR